MVCENCKSEKLILIDGKTSDRCHVFYMYNGIESDGYVPSNIGIGGDDYISFIYCLNCGMIQGDFPIE